MIRTAIAMITLMGGLFTTLYGVLLAANGQGFVVFICGIVAGLTGCVLGANEANRE